MSLSYAFDLYPRDDPKDGARLVRFTALQDAEWTAEASWCGKGWFTIRGDHAEAAFIDPRGLQYVRVVEIDSDTVDAGTTSGFAEAVVGGFWLEVGSFSALSASMNRLLKFGGRGTMAYLEREILWSRAYNYTADNLIDGTTWHFYNQASITGGDYLGAVLWRVMAEAQSFDASPTELDDKPDTAIPDSSTSFGQFNDPGGNAWTVPSGEFKAQIGDNILGIVSRLIGAGLYVEMDPDTFVLNAWERGAAGSRGQDKSGAAWGAGVVRFQKTTDGTIPTGNMLADADRVLQAYVRRTTILAGDNGTYVRQSLGSDIPYHGFKQDDSQNTETLVYVANSQLDAREDAGDVLRQHFKLGNDASTGKYRPFGTYDLDDPNDSPIVQVNDTVIVDTGSGEWDYEEDTFPVASLTVKLRPGGDWEPWADLGETYTSMAERAAQARGVPTHSHPPNPQLCSDTLADALLGLSGASLKVSSTEGAFTKDKACDGDIDTHWSGANGTDPPESYWAADLGEAKDARSYRIVQGVYSTGSYTGTPSDSNIADEIRIYGSNDPAAWAWLPADELAADPADNGWTLVHTDTEGAGPPAAGDHGTNAFAQTERYRYWLFRAVTGGTGGNSWDVGVIELNVVTDKPMALAQDAQGTHGVDCTCAARGCHTHEHGQQTGPGPHHSADAITFAPIATIAATNVQDAIAEVASEAGGSITAREVDASPSVAASVIEFPNGTLTDQGGGVARYTPTAASGLINIAHVNRTTLQTIASSTVTAIGFDAEISDPAGYHDTVTNNPRLTVPSGKDGIHIFGGSFMWSNDSGGQRQWFFRVNGVTVRGYDIRGPGGTFGVMAMVVSPPLNLSAGDYVELCCWQDSGANRNVVNAVQAEFWAARLGAAA